MSVQNDYEYELTEFFEIAICRYKEVFPFLQKN